MCWTSAGPKKGLTTEDTENTEIPNKEAEAVLASGDLRLNIHPVRAEDVFGGHSEPRCGNVPLTRTLRQLPDGDSGFRQPVGTTASAMGILSSELRAKIFFRCGGV